MENDKLKATLKKHSLWLRGDPCGTHANLTGADLRSADLRSADLRSADLRSANLTGADLRSADLRSANLRTADLPGADLTGADLRGANLKGADLRGANLKGADLPDFSICPEEGDFIGWKKVQGHIVKLLIPAAANRTSCLIDRKCRAEFARVLDWDAGKDEVLRSRDECEYLLGQLVRPDSYDDDIRVACTHGIHFFITRKEAEHW